MSRSQPNTLVHSSNGRLLVTTTAPRHTEALEGLAIEMLARGLSVRDIEDAFRDALRVARAHPGRRPLGKLGVAFNP